MPPVRGPCADFTAEDAAPSIPGWLQVNYKRQDDRSAGESHPSSDRREPSIARSVGRPTRQPIASEDSIEACLPAAELLLGSVGSREQIGSVDERDDNMTTV